MSTKMNPDAKREWVNALRGEFANRQAYGKLKKDNCFCVLGLLCEVFRRTHPDYKWFQKESEVRKGKTFSTFGTNPEKASQSMIPAEVAKWAGLWKIIIPLPVDHKYGNVVGTSIIYLNDTMRVPFDELADMIDQYL